VVSINGRYHLLPMEKSLARRDNYYLLNPSYFSPAHYRIFAEVDSERQSEWLQLAEDTYLVLGNRMPTNWLMVNDKTGALSSASPYITQGSADSFGYDAFRTFWRVALDESWYKSEDAERYLKNVSRPFVSEWQQYGSFGDLYTAQGGRIRDTSNPAIAAGILSALKVGAPQQVSSDVYAKLFAETLVIDEESEYAYWLSPDNYYESNWIWFGVALYNNNLPNLWRLHQQR
jgi:endoglucanase